MTKDRDILASVDSPEQLRMLSHKELSKYCDELRSYIIDECSTNPGHLSSSLGVVELTVALHHVFNTPHDKIVWDVGHQTYPHKIITCRREAFRNKRRRGGISGFPKMSESVFDSFGGGHASISISAAYGLAKGLQMGGEKRSVVAVIGDGSMTGGLAFEGLNNLGADQQSDVLVILNDNNMSIDHSTGALSKYLLRISTSRGYNSFKHRLWQMLSHTPLILNTLRAVGRLVKRGVLHKSNLFESLNMRYFGPIDGHNLPSMIRTLSALKDIKGPKLLHVITTKGKGYEPAENNVKWHAPGYFNPETGEIIRNGVSVDRFQDVFGYTLLELANLDSRVVGITPAMLSGSSMNILNDSMPERCFDVGIAEGHAVTFAAGVAAAGLRPFCNIYSSFMQRAYDNVIHDVTIQNLPVTLCLDRGGLVGEDGATHHGVYDLAYLSAIPQMVVAAPRNELELRQMMYTALQSNRPFAIRYPRGCGEGVEWRSVPFEEVEIGRATMLRQGDNKIVILSVGSVANDASRAIDRVKESISSEVTHYDLRFAKPLDYTLLESLAANYSEVVTIEDGTLRGGVGEAIAAFINSRGVQCRVTSLGVPDRFIDHGTIDQLHAECGYGVDEIASTLQNIYQRSNGAK